MDPEQRCFIALLFAWTIWAHVVRLQTNFPPMSTGTFRCLQVVVNFSLICAHNNDKKTFAVGTWWCLVQCGTVVLGPNVLAFIFIILIITKSDAVAFLFIFV